MSTLFGDEMPNNVEKACNKLQALQTSDSAEWYTPAKYIQAARQVMGGIDLDPASCEMANQTVKASCIYTKEQDGLRQPWYGRVWCNPPYGRDDAGSNQEAWSGHLISQYKAGNTIEAILLVNASTATRWFQRLWAYPVCFTHHKIRFYSAQSKSNQPTHGNAFVYLGPQEDRFIEIFSQFGAVTRCVSATRKQPSLWDEVSA